MRVRLAIAGVSVLPLCLLALTGGVRSQDAEADRGLVEDRKTLSQNLQQIALALHNFHDDYDHFPKSATYSKEGKPLLSWRVALLPYLEQGELFKLFKQDEPWDSPHNKKLLERIPAAYLCPGPETTEKHSTYCQVLVGERTLFHKDKTSKLLELANEGTSFLMLVVEAGEAVPWTKPADVHYEHGKPLPKLGYLSKQGFTACFCDRVARFIKREMPERLLRQLIDCTDGFDEKAWQFTEE